MKMSELDTMKSATTVLCETEFKESLLGGISVLTTAVFAYGDKLRVTLKNN